MSGHAVANAIGELVSRLGEPNRAGSELVWCCPFCEERGKSWPDTKYHLYVNMMKTEHTGPKGLMRSPLGFAFCHRCGYGASTVAMLRALGLGGFSSFDLDEWSLIRDRIHELGTPGGREWSVEDTPEETAYPSRTVPLKSWMASWAYLRHRGFTGTEIRRHGARVGAGAHWGFRVFLPVHDDDGRLVFWVARWFGEDACPGPKYRNPWGVPRKWFLYNFWPTIERLREKEDDVVWIAEGALSSWACGPTGLATFGVYTTVEQQRLLLTMPARAGLKGSQVTYRIVPDGEPAAMKQGLKLARALHRRGRKVDVVQLPDREDPASVPREYLREAVPIRYRGTTTETRIRLAQL